MNYLVLLLICWVSLKIISKIKLKMIFISLAKTYKKLTKLIFSSRISDAHKEQMIPFYALLVAGNSLKVLLIFIFIIGLLASPSFFLHGYRDFLLSSQGILSSIIFCWFILKLKLSRYFDE